MLRKTESRPGVAGQLRRLRPGERLWAVPGVMASTLLPPPRLLGVDCYAEEEGLLQEEIGCFRNVVSHGCARQGGGRGDCRDAE